MMMMVDYGLDGIFYALRRNIHTCIQHDILALRRLLARSDSAYITLPYRSEINDGRCASQPSDDGWTVRGEGRQGDK